MISKNSHLGGRDEIFTVGQAHEGIVPVPFDHACDHIVAAEEALRAAARAKNQEVLVSGSRVAAHARLVDLLVSLLHWSDERGVLLSDALDQAEAVFLEIVEEGVLVP